MDIESLIPWRDIRKIKVVPESDVNKIPELSEGNTPFHISIIFTVFAFRIPGEERRVETNRNINITIETHICFRAIRTLRDNRDIHSS